MIVITGEGLYDQIFFDEILRNIQCEQQIQFRYKAMANNLNDLLTCIGRNFDRCTFYRCFVWGDHGKSNLLLFSLQIMRSILGKIRGNSYLYIIRDIDHENIKQIKENWFEEIQVYATNKNLYNRMPVFEKIDDHTFCITKDRHHIYVKLIFIQRSLEYQICNTFIQKEGLKIDMNGKNDHEILEEIALKLIEEGSEKKEKILKLIRKSYPLLKNVDWIQTFISEFKENVKIISNV